MPSITVRYPNGNYTLHVSDAQYHIHSRVLLIDGTNAANHLARLWVGANRTRRAQQGVHVAQVMTPVVHTPIHYTWCIHRGTGCVACADEVCPLRTHPST